MWAPGGLGPAGWDRRRVGARLRAALAGLQELQGLRATQQARVRGALGLHPAPGPHGQELRLEAALAALREQLSRLRRQDAGLKTHLDQLDQQISELQLDVTRSFCEAPDSDSRPSSGFYELSDAGSCSLSTSCASVCSDRLSPSLGSWLPLFQPAKPRPSMGDWRPRSADETTVPAWSPQPNREGSKLPHGAEDTGRPRGLFRPRPVSTGDLERVLPADLGLQRAGADTASTSLLYEGIEIPAHTLDPKYQCDLVARDGQEVYPYPSPLHAVALQSPLFALPKEAPDLDSPSPPQKPSPVAPADENRAGTGPDRELGSAEAYIDRLLRLRGREAPLRGAVGEQEPLGCDTSPFLQKFCGQGSDDGGQLAKTVRGAMELNRGKDSLRQVGPVPPVDAEAPGNPLKEGATPWHPCAPGENARGSSPCPQAQQSHSDDGQRQGQSPSRLLGPRSPALVPGSFAHLPCTTGEAFPMRLRMGPPQSKAVKVRRRVGDKVPRLGKQAPPRSERQQGIQATPPLPAEWDPSPKPQGGGLSRRYVLAREPPGRSCSESTLYPVPFVPLVVAQHSGYRASSQALFPVEVAPFNPAVRRKQHRWQSTVEISAKAHSVSCPEPSLRPPRSPTGRAVGPWAQSRPTLARQDACVRSESDPSEHSAECTSLFHSTIAETSEEEEASDHTANCFGDESSGSDSEICVQSRGRGQAMGGAGTGQREQAWPQAVPQQHPRVSGSAKPPLPPVPKLCRIKASKALKKKIRRFQPAALKVMTMV